LLLDVNVTAGYKLAMLAKKTLKTPFGVVDRQALEELQGGSYETFALLQAVDAIDEVRNRDDELREGVLALHGMAHNLINGDGSAGSKREESIGELAWDMIDKLRLCVEELEKAIEAVEPLTPLLANPDDEAADAQLSENDRVAEG